ncbi:MULTISPECIES: globin-coupled sensor protein [unclassified Xanthobacter]|uniref:globin-coupled sensor protein n=1 Tax=unclassified Xanthobacter TaxID=2623496 RepID=UPI001F368BBE|nr:MULTISPECIES: globin-coupled sensor protein [unclassified Xanthobacter]
MSSDLNMRDRLKFNLIDNETAALLKSSKADILHLLSDVLDRFYEHVGSEPETRRFFGSPEQMQRAKRMQLNHWSVILDARFDEEYEASVTRIGEMHNKLGLDPHWYIGGYSFLISHLVASLGHEHMSGALFARRKAEHAMKLQTAVIRVAILDMDLAIQVYLQAGQRDRTATLSRLAHSFEETVGSVVSVVSSSVADLHTTAQGMTAFVEQTSAQSQAVAAASEHASDNVATVAAATEQLSASVREISRQVAQSAEVTTRAVADVGQASSKVKTLADATDHIGSIIGLISEIAGRTNLLALNATIEAAHAGAAGRGFAVVADEVKQLAEQTSKATSEIRSQIETIQADTEATLVTIEGISGTIGTINSVAESISDAVRQQESATQEIARNIHDASQGTIEVTSSIGRVTEAMTESNSAATRVFSAASDLTRQLDTLNQEVRRFLSDIKVA